MKLWLNKCRLKRKWSYEVYEVYEDPRKPIWLVDNNPKSTQSQPETKEVNDVQNYKLYNHKPGNVSTKLSDILELSKAIENCQRQII